MGVVEKSIGVSINKSIGCGASVSAGSVLPGCYGDMRWSRLVGVGASWEDRMAAKWCSCAVVRSCCRDLGPVRWPLHFILGSDFSAAILLSTFLAERLLLPLGSPAAGVHDLIYFC
jgi:hypothetical protein